MQDQKTEQWDPFFFQKTPLFWPITPALPKMIINSPSWPTLYSYNQLLPINTTNENQKRITFIEQRLSCEAFEDEYEPGIFLTGEVQTRLSNWHDFFQVLIWKTFPKTKALLNRIHYVAAIERRKKSIKQRSPQENFVTLFDECGSIVLATDEDILGLVKRFEWNRFFIDNQSLFGKSIDCVVFGHAMYEKALSPYIGMTSHCLLLPIDLKYFELTVEKKTHYIDDIVSNHIRQISEVSPRSLNPLPILGVPGWHNDQTIDFYSNQSYFRPGRKRK